jgi:DnaJ-class molecular chaperone
VRIPEQIQRLAVITAVIIVGVLVARFILIPRSLISDELHRASTIQRENAKPIKFAGSTTCQDCHEDKSTQIRKGYHKNLSCEGCHGPAAQHAENPMGVKPFAPRDRKFCPLCHGYDASRPTGFPQINPTAHNPVKPCITCHNPHDPVPLQVPQSCSACHAQIQRTTAVSSHALLRCTTCHNVPAQHKTTPRSVMPSKPSTREFCGTCHGKESTQKDAPKIDLTNHGNAYLCWQCHYPHLPEGRG